MTGDRDGKVVALPGFSLPSPVGEPVPAVVEILREFLAWAECGDLRAIAIAGIRHSVGNTPMAETNWCAVAGSSWDLYAALGRLNRKYEKWLDE